MQELKLTPASYIVLGLVEWAGGEATPYTLKQMATVSVGNLWSLQHAQLYSEPERLAAAGYLDVEQEDSGRRRKNYRLTTQGRDALDAWRGEPTADLGELRDPGLLKLFMGADPALIAPAQLEAHRAKLAEYEALRAATDDPTAGPMLTLDAGIACEKAFVRFWEDLV